jgi:hypothetical protein
MGSEILSWLRRRRERAQWIETEATALIRDLGIGAYAEARRNEREANTIKAARDWNHVAVAIARRTCEAVGVDASGRMASDAIFASLLQASAAPRAPLLDEGQIDELRRIVSDEPPAQFRLQFLGAAPDNGPTVVGEVGVQATDVATAVRQAIHIPWPPLAIGFRLIDQEGREVFGRQQGDRRS